MRPSLSNLRKWLGCAQKGLCSLEKPGLLAQTHSSPPTPQSHPSLTPQRRSSLGPPQDGACENPEGAQRENWLKQGKLSREVYLKWAARVVQGFQRRLTDVRASIATGRMPLRPSSSKAGGRRYGHTAPRGAHGTCTGLCSNYLSTPVASALM